MLGLSAVVDLSLPRRRRSSIMYGDKKGLKRFHHFADHLYGKRGLDVKMHELIGYIELGDSLRQPGEKDRQERKSRGSGAVHWRRNAGSTDDDFGMRWRIDEALSLLGTMTTMADEEFEATHGGQTQRRDKSNPKRCGAGSMGCIAGVARVRHGLGAPRLKTEVTRA